MGHTGAMPTAPPPTAPPPPAPPRPGPRLRRPLEVLADLAVFAPIGLAEAVRDRLPELAAAGRHRVESDLRQARVVGELAATELKRRAEAMGGRTAPAPVRGRTARAPERAGPARRAATPGPDQGAPAPAATPPGRRQRVPEAEGGVPLAAELPIPGYDSLSASQVVQRLPGLSAPELAGIRRYEQAGRGRKTVLLRIGQLLGET